MHKLPVYDITPRQALCKQLESCLVQRNINSAPADVQQWFQQVVSGKQDAMLHFCRQWFIVVGQPMGVTSYSMHVNVMQRSSNNRVVA